MTKSLPPNPSLRYLKEESKDILKAHKSGDTYCCPVLKYLTQFQGRTDEEILRGRLGLQEVHFALAMEYGFESWDALKLHVSGGQGPKRAFLYGFRYNPIKWAEGIISREAKLEFDDNDASPQPSTSSVSSKQAKKLAMEVANMKLGAGCPWGDAEKVRDLWRLRDHADISVELEQGLTLMMDSIQDGKGWPVYLDPWGFVNCVAEVAHPLASSILIKQIPLILRGQLEDGTWAGNSLSDITTESVISALVKHKIFDELRHAPPLPPDWHAVRSIPTPKGDFRSMTWDGDNLWIYDQGSGEAISLSPAKGEVISRTLMPAGTNGITWHDGQLVSVNGKERSVQRVDSRSGELGEKTSIDIPWGELSGITTFEGGLCVGHVQRASAHFIDSTVPFHDDPETSLTLGGTGAVDMATDTDSIWYIDLLGPVIIRSKPHEDGCIIDWGEKPFGEDTTGIAHDGKNLWVLDNKAKRICVIEKTESGKHLASYI